MMQLLRLVAFLLLAQVFWAMPQSADSGATTTAAATFTSPIWQPEAADTGQPQFLPTHQCEGCMGHSLAELTESEEDSHSMGILPCAIFRPDAVAWVANNRVCLHSGFINKVKLFILYASLKVDCCFAVVA